VIEQDGRFVVVHRFPFREENTSNIFPPL